MLKLFKPYISPKAIKNVTRVLKGTQIAEGPEVKEFENEFGRIFNKKNVVALNSGTSALELAYELAQIKEGDEVITPVLTCTATNIPLKRIGAKIVFADIDYDLNINIEDVKRKITKKTKAIVFVHFGGNNRGLNELIALARKHRLVLIEDAAQAVGSANWGRSDFTCVSLQAIKSLTSGDGGILICKDDEAYKKAKRLRWFGYDREEKQKKGDTDLTEAGYKYHMNDVTAAIGNGNLEDIHKVLNHRKKLVKEYKKYGFQANIWFAWKETDSIERTQKLMLQNGIETGIHHYRNDKYTLFGGRQQFPVMDEMEDHYLLYPLHMGVKLSDVRRIAKVIEKDGRTD